MYFFIHEEKCVLEYRVKDVIYLRKEMDFLSSGENIVLTIENDYLIVSGKYNYIFALLPVE